MLRRLLAVLQPIAGMAAAGTVTSLMPHLVAVSTHWPASPLESSEALSAAALLALIYSLLRLPAGAMAAAGAATSLMPFLSRSVSTLWHALARPSCAILHTE